MNRPFRVALLALGLSLLVGPEHALLAQGTEKYATTEGHRYGLAVGAAMSASPLGEIAERHGTYGVPGKQFEVRLFARAPERHEWSVALLWDDYHIGQQLDRTASYAFDYGSRSLVVGFQAAPDGQGQRLVYGLDAGWVRYAAEASSINYYTGEPYASSIVGDAALLGFSAGLEIPGKPFVTVPRVRMEMNFPDFGGGDAYSGLHREIDLGFKASFGVALKLNDLF